MPAPLASSASATAQGPVSLVVGADGLIGQALLATLQAQGHDVVGTSRRPARPSGCMITLDLAAPPTTWALPDTVTTAYVCAGVASIQACEDRPADTARVNCDGTIALARRLLAMDAQVIHLSSNQVYDGQSSHRLPHEPTSPQSEYGRQKARTEQALLEHAAGLRGVASIVRLTKVLAPGNPLLGGWRRHLLAGRPIHPFHDMRMAPVTLRQVVAGLLAVAQARRSGITHLSGSQDITYEAAGRHLARRLHASPDLVQPCSAREVGLTPAMTPLHTTLDMAATTADLGIAALAAEQALDETLPG